VGSYILRVRYNLKRKVASLSIVSVEEFEKRKEAHEIQIKVGMSQVFWLATQSWGFHTHAFESSDGHLHLKKGSLPNTLPFLRVDCQTNIYIKFAFNSFKKGSLPNTLPFLRVVELIL